MATAPSGEDSKMTLIFRSSRRWLHSRRGRLPFCVLVVGVSIILLNLLFYFVYLDNPALTLTTEVKENLYRYVPDDVTVAIRQAATLSPGEIERKRRISVFSRIFHKQTRKQKKNGNQQCLHPKLDLKHDTNQFAYHAMPPLNCTGNGFFTSHNGILTLNTSVIPDPTLLAKCSFFSVERVSDNIYNYEEPLVIEQPPFEAKINSDFVLILCVLKSTVAEDEKTKKENVEEKDEEEEEKKEEEEEDGEDKDYRKIGGEEDGDKKKNGEGMRDKKSVNKRSARKDKKDAKKNNGDRINNDQNETNNEYDTDVKMKGNVDNTAGERTEENVDNENNEADENNEDNESATFGPKFADPFGDDIFGPYYYSLGGYKDLQYPDSLDSDFTQFLVNVRPKKDVFDRIDEINSRSSPPPLSPSHSKNFEPSNPKNLPPSSHSKNSQLASNPKNLPPSSHPMKLNVLMFAMDSMSHLCYQRKMPKTYRYLKEELGAAILENYNIVGDATTAALIPILTGRTEMDLPEVRSSMFEAGSVDEYPMIWSDYREQGYATLYAEDEPSIATFNLRFTGFHESPTDHYMRPFWQAVWESSLRQSSPKFCTGNIPHHRFMLNYIEDFFVQYRNVSKFAFGFSVELTHWDNNPAEYADGDLAAMLERLRKAKLLEDTVVVLFGDHGARYSKVRHTVQGKLEERLPMMAFAFPQKFRQRYPKLFHNLLTNTHRLSTPFDIHETLLDILNLTRAHEPVPANAKSMSLLRPIPAERTCSDAGISMHWCTCMHQVTVATDEEFVRPAASELVQHLNLQISNHRDQCAELNLGKILNAQIVIPNEQVLKFRKSKDEDQRVANFSREVDPDVVHYQLQVETTPCGAVFEATVLADFRNSTNYHFSVTPGISRINLYGSQPACVQEKYPLLRKFCCCKDYLKREERGRVKNGDFRSVGG